MTKLPKVTRTAETVGQTVDPKNGSTTYRVRLYFRMADGSISTGVGGKKAGGYASHAMAVSAIVRKAPDGAVAGITCDVRNGNGVEVAIG